MLLAAGLFGCGGNGDSTANQPDGTGTISGIVVALDTGRGLSSVAVSAGGRSTTTDTSGRYTLTAVPAANPAVVTFDIAGYVRSASSETLVSGGNISADPILTTLATTQQFNASDAIVVKVLGSMGQVSLAANSLVTALTGAAASGVISAQVTPIYTEANPATMPGNFHTTGAGGPVTIETFGALNVVLRDSGGNALDLASGKTANLRIPIATRSATLPTSVALHYFDESTGLWVEQGMATLRGIASRRFYEGTVQHVGSTWSASRPIETVLVTGCVRDRSTGEPTQGVKVEANGTNYSSTASVQTDAQGNFTLPILRGAGVAALYGHLGDRFTNVLSVGPVDVDQALASCLQLESGNSPPAIAHHPESVGVPAGECVRYSVQAVGTHPLAYQWYREITVLVGTAPIKSICPGYSDQMTDLTAVVSNSFGTTRSKTAFVGVTPPPPPVILTQPADQQVRPGAMATFSVEAIAPGSSIYYQWLRDGAPISGAVELSYTTPPTSLTDNGAQFSVLVTAFAGSVSSSVARLTVSEAAAPAPSR